MIRIKAIEPIVPERVIPHFRITMHYVRYGMNSPIAVTGKIKVDNPNLERFYKLVNGLVKKPRWYALTFTHRILDDLYEDGDLTYDDRLFLAKILFGDNEDPNAQFFYMLNHLDVETMIFQRAELHYIDENGCQHDTEIE